MVEILAYLAQWIDDVMSMRIGEFNLYMLALAVLIGIAIKLIIQSIWK